MPKKIVSRDRIATKIFGKGGAPLWRDFLGGKTSLKKISPPQNGFTSSERASALTAVIGVDVHILMPEVGSEQRIAAGTGTQHDVDGQIALLEGLFEQGVEI